MPRRFSTSPLHRGATAVLCRLILVLANLTVIATAHAAAQVFGRSPAPTRPYLATMGAPMLRFQEPAPPPPPRAKPVAGGPPVAASAPEEAEVSLANSQAAASTPPMPLPDEAKGPATTPAAETPVPGVPAEPAKAATPAAPKSLPILPDDTRRKVQSQDFLPLFRLPGSGSLDDASVILPGVPVPPAPGTLPPSSATYRVN